MLLREFYETVLPSSGRYVIFHNKANTFYDTLDQLEAATTKRIDSQGVYFALASFGDETKVTDSGKTVLVRTQTNVLKLRSYWVDIDAGVEKFAKHPDGAYPTQDDAITALMAAVKGGLPRPSIVVSSGEGLHVYWTLSEELAADNWKPGALQLNAAGKALGLRIDAACTADSARVLRPITTPHKNGTRVKVLRSTGVVHDHAEFVATLAKHAPAMPTYTPTQKGPKVRDINDDITEVKSPPASLARVAQHCSAVALMRDKQGNVPEPHWRAVMGVAKYCEVDGEEVVHQWSAGHPDYDPSETQQKFDRWETPPTKCITFAAMHDGCSKCKYKSKVTTPKQLGYVQEDQDAVQPGVRAPDAESTAPPSPPVAPTPALAELGGGMALPDDADEEDSEPSDAGMVTAGIQVAVTDATGDCPVPEHPELFDETETFFYKRNGSHWTLYHRYTVTSTDATGQKVNNKVVKPVIHKLIWVDSSSDVGASDTEGVLVQFGRVMRAGSPQQDRFDMPAGIASEVGTLMKFMVDQGVNPDPKNENAGKHLRHFIGEQMIRKQNDMRFVIKNRFGYHKHGDRFVCCLGQYTVYDDGTIVRTVINSKLTVTSAGLQPGCLPPKDRPTWGPSDWPEIEAVGAQYSNFIRRHYYHEGYGKARLVLALALSSPFLVFATDAPYHGERELPATGFVVSMYSSSSGVGKSAIEEVICAAYGKPQLKHAGKKSLMTDVAAYTSARDMGIYPFVLDEVTQNDAKTVAAQVEIFANGTGKRRGISDGSLSRDTASWALITVMSTNVPQRELVAAAQSNSEALQMRLLELDFSDLPLTGDREAFRTEFRELSTKSGAFGLIQARAAAYLGPDRLIELCERNRVKAEKLLGLDQRYRFYVRALAAALTNMQILGRLNPFEEQDIVQAFREAVGQTKAFVASRQRTPADILTAMLNAAAPHILVTDSWTKSNPKVPSRGDVLLNPNFQTPVAGRQVTSLGYVLVSRTFVNDWCAKNQVASSTLIPQLRKAGMVADGMMNPDGSPKKYRLDTGLLGKTADVGTQVCYAFKLTPALEEAEAVS